MMKNIINATPHDICIVNDEMEVIKTFKSELQVRVSSKSEVVGNINSINIDTITFGEIVGLPEYKEGTYYIVSRIVKYALPNRDDLLCPGQQVRNELGQVVGCKSLSI